MTFKRWNHCGNLFVYLFIFKGQLIKNTTCNALTGSGEDLQFLFSTNKDLFEINSNAKDFFSLRCGTLTNFKPMFPFYTPWKRQKTRSFLTFSGGIGREHWPEMGLTRLLQVLLKFSSVPQRSMKNMCYVS